MGKYEFIGVYVSKSIFCLNYFSGWENKFHRNNMHSDSSLQTMQNLQKIILHKKWPLHKFKS